MSGFVSRFSPGEMPPELLERIFTQERRQRLADDLTARARDSALTGSKYHDLLVGERGMGKTHLVSVVAHRLMAMEDLKDRLALAWLVEEEWGIASFFDLLLRLFRALDPTLDNGQRRCVDALLDITDSDAAEDAARKLLLEVLGERTLIVIAENLDDIFAGLGDPGQKSLRAFVQESRQVALLATTPALFAGVSAHTEAFYGFFRITHLEEFDLEDARSLIRQVAEWRGDTALVSYLATDQATARLKTVTTLAGGLPRLYVVFADLLSAQSLDELVDAFLEMLDDLNDYFRSRMERLSRTQQKVVEYLCRLPGAHQSGTLVREVARQCRISPGVASKEIERLVGFGYLRPYAVGRETYYDLREPMLRLWHEKKQGRERPVRLLVEYLKCWFERGELERWLSISEPGTLASDTAQGGYEALRIGRVLSLELAQCKKTVQELLVAALTEQTPQIAAAEMPLERAEAWRAAVPDARGTALELPLRLLDAVVRYKAKPDPRVALSLPPEERVVLEKILRDAGLWIELNTRPRRR